MHTGRYSTVRRLTVFLLVSSAADANENHYDDETIMVARAADYVAWTAINNRER